MRPAFADTSFYIALLRSDDPAHDRAIRFARRDVPIVTTQCVVLELGNAFSRSIDHGDFLALVRALRDSERVRIVPLDTELIDRGLDLMASRPDKDWSLTDCISFIVMRELRLIEALTTDRHFEQAGFSALLR